MITLFYRMRNQQYRGFFGRQFALQRHVDEWMRTFKHTYTEAHAAGTDSIAALASGALITNGEDPVLFDDLPPSAVKVL